MEMFEVCKPAPWLNLSKEGAYFDLDGSGFLLVYNYNSPTPGEIAAFQAGTACEFRFVRVGGVLFLLSKLGPLPWNDSPFALQLAVLLPCRRFRREKAMRLLWYCWTTKQRSCAACVWWGWVLSFQKN